MKKRNLRAIIAAEHPQTRELLKDVVKKEGTFLVGEAQDATKVVTLARNLRPDITIIDSNLPHFVGLDTIRLSRMGGLDTAQLIAEAIPSMRVVIMTNLDTQVLAERNLNMDATAFFSEERIGGNVPLKLRDLCQEAVLTNAPVFADVEVEPWAEENKQGTDGALVFSSVSIPGGLYLIGTLWLAPYGVLLVLAGIVALGFGLLKIIAVRLWRK